MAARRAVAIQCSQVLAFLFNKSWVQMFCGEGRLSPTLFRERGYRFYFFSREEARMHVHVYHADGEAKFWMEPEISLAQNYGLSQQALRDVETMVRSHEKEIRDAWNKHFAS